MTLSTIFMSAFPLGVAKRALADFGPEALTRRRPTSLGVIAEDPATQVEVGRAAAGLAGARSYFVDVAGEIWGSALAGDPTSVAQRGRL